MMMGSCANRPQLQFVRDAGEEKRAAFDSDLATLPEGMQLASHMHLSRMGVSALPMVPV
jgi:hypothetical protein